VIDKKKCLPLRTRTIPQAMSNKPMPIIIVRNNSVWKIDSNCTVLVNVKMVVIKTSRPVKERKPPKAIFNLWVIEKVGILPHLI
jgi:hypothetical protein